MFLLIRSYWFWESFVKQLFFTDPWHRFVGPTPFICYRSCGFFVWPGVGNQVKGLLVSFNIGWGEHSVFSHFFGSQDCVTYTGQCAIQRLGCLWRSNRTCSTGWNFMKSCMNVSFRSTVEGPKGLVSRNSIPTLPMTCLNSHLKAKTVRNGFSKWNIALQNG